LMSTWRPESEISRLNAAAGSGTWTRLSRETLAVLAAARRLAQLSGGAFDVTVGPLMWAWGFRGRDEPHRPAPATLDSARALVGSRLLELDSAGGSARLLARGATVDLGAIAKGYALDLAAAAMQAAGATAGMVDLGGNVLVFGPPPEGREAWVIGILDPRDPAATMGEIRLRAGSVASSGDYEQFFEAAGVRYSHIMDPATGEPARGTLQTTVVAPTGLQSDGLSTTLFVLGPERGRSVLARPFARGAAVVWVRDSLPLDASDVVVAGADPGRIRIAMPGRR
ncbi:MAG: FAD:protein FMN transferase, partial [Gemmatimonadetes bacterium]|nr:FAD:protein FMN transferase [Gemmatimonadota bacterium]